MSSAHERSIKTRIDFCQNGTGFCWFVDVWINGGWKNVSSHKTEHEAKEQAALLKSAHKEKSDG